MAAPKEQGRIPIKRGIKFVRKAGCWLYFEAFGKENTPDKWEWFDTQEAAQNRYDNK
jgi:hypothetical protein